MRITSLFSGSKGNCTLVSTGSNNVLIDVGTSMSKITEALMIAEGIDLYDVDVILISHS